MKAVSLPPPRRAGGARVHRRARPDARRPSMSSCDVEACALNRLDLVQRDGWYHMPGFTYPHIAGMDIAGTVVVDRRRRDRRRRR